MTRAKRCRVCKRELPRPNLETLMQQGTGLCIRCVTQALNGVYSTAEGREWLRVWGKRLADAIRVTLE